MRQLPSLQEHTGIALAASFIGYGVLAWFAATVLAGIALLRGGASRPARILMLLAVLGLLVQGVWLAGAYVPDGRRIEGEQLRVVSLNLLAGQADPVQLMRHARHADLLVLVEITPEAEQALGRAGLSSALPYRVGRSEVGTHGTMIYSRWPLSPGVRLSGSFGQWLTTAQTPGGPIMVAGVHPCNPLCGAQAWLTESSELLADLRPHLGGPLIVAGDFNAVDDHRTMRDLHAAGLHSANDLAGGGWNPTYPHEQRLGGLPLPPLIGIDHILLTAPLTASTFHTFAVAGSDHRGVTARVGRVSR